MQEQLERDSLAKLVCELNIKGHNPATSGNYSFKSPEFDNRYFISASGVDKSAFRSDHFLPVNSEGLLHPEFTGEGRTSAETDLHMAIYRWTDAGCILHSHVLSSLLFGQLHSRKPLASVSGLELLKGFHGIDSHEAEVKIPIIENSQNMQALVRELEPFLRDTRPLYGFVLKGHGLYCWGRDVAEAKRHLEVFEYLFQYTLGVQERPDGQSKSARSKATIDRILEDQSISQ